jgi:HAE1 family hydrophobic/amphiphilic exporter-1
MAAVITSYSGAGPEEVESQITKVMEGSLNSLSGVTEIQSTSSDGSSVVLLMFDWGTNMDSAMLDIRENISFVESFLPEGAGKPMVVKMDPNMMPILQIGVSGGDLEQIQDIAEDIIEPRLSRIPEIASVYLTGGNVRQISVEVDPVKLENYNLSISQITSGLVPFHTFFQLLFQIIHKYYSIGNGYPYQHNNPDKGWNTKGSPGYEQ